MGLYADAIAGVKTVILIDQRVQTMTTKLDQLVNDVRDLKERLIRLETIVEITREGGGVLRIARRPGDTGTGDE